MVDMTKNTTEKKLTQSDIRGVFIRSNLFQGSWNFERILTIFSLINLNENRYHLVIKIALFCYCFIF